MLPEARSTLRNRLTRGGAAGLVGGMRGDGAHVPDHGALGIEIGRDHEQPPPGPVTGGDIGQQLRRDLLGDQVLQRPGIEKALAGRADFENVGRGDLGIGVLQGGVVFGAGKGERRHQRAGADPGDDRIIRPVAGGAQAVEETGAERAVGAAGREDEPRSRLRRQRLLEVGFGVGPEPGVRHAGNGGCGFVGGGERRAWRKFWLLCGGTRSLAGRLRRPGALLAWALAWCRTLCACAVAANGLCGGIANAAASTATAAHVAIVQRAIGFIID